jgi:hypothetical protein
MVPKTEPQRIGEMRRAKNGGSGVQRQSAPDPHTTHIPEAIVQVVYE